MTLEHETENGFIALNDLRGITANHSSTPSLQYSTFPLFPSGFIRAQHF